MFNPFKKKKGYSDYVIDLGKLKSRGVIKSEDSAVADASSTSDSGLGFLGSMAQASSQGLGGAVDVSDDIKEKISTMSERVYKLLDRLDLMEHKIDRIERKLGLREEF
jgi:hypothetical protein